MPLCDEEILWTFATYVHESSSEDSSGLGSADAVAENARCVEVALTGIERARWWPPEAGYLPGLARVFVDTDVRTGKRFHFVCAVFNRAEACRRWADSTVVRQSIEDKMKFEASDYIRH